MTATDHYTPYEVPDSALVDRGIVRDCNRSVYVECMHDRDGWDHETDAEKADMNAMRIGGWGEGSAMAVLAHHQQMVDDARIALIQAEIDAWNEGHPMTPEGEKPWLFLDPFEAKHLYVPDYGWTGFKSSEEPGHPVFETKLLARDEVRVPWLIKEAEGWHEAGEHSEWMHAYCTYCRRDEDYAEASLRWFLAGNPGANVPRGEEPNGEVDEGPLADLYKPSALHAMPKAEPLVEINGSVIIPKHSVGYCAGFDGVYKTFAVLGIACSLAITGRKVLYLMGEGIEGTEDRLTAWCQHRGVTLSDLDAGLDIKASTVNLFDAGADFEALLGLIDRERYDLVVVDTLARSVGAANQDNNSEMSVVTQRLDRVKRRSGGSVVVVAHTGKDGDKGIRGASALRANADFAVTMKRIDEDRIRMSTKPEHGGKMKNAPQDFELLLAVKPVGPSLVLIDAAKRPEVKILESSHSNENRVLVALGRLYPLSFVPQTQIRGVVAEDGSGKGQINDGTVSKVVARLVADGVIEKHATQKLYRLNPAHDRAAKILEALP